MYGIGGVVGSLAGGYATEYGKNSSVFLAIAGIGFLISLSGCFMSTDIEASAQSIIEMTLLERVKLNF